MWWAQVPSLVILLELILLSNCFSFFRSVQVIFFWNYFSSSHWFLSAVWVCFCFCGLILVFALARCPAQIFVYESIGKNRMKPIVPKGNVYNTFFLISLLCLKSCLLWSNFFFAKTVQCSLYSYCFLWSMTMIVYKIRIRLLLPIGVYSVIWKKFLQELQVKQII